MTEMEQRREAFAALVQPHLPTLWRCIRRLVRETQDAEDLVQETCLKAFRALHHFQPGTNAKAWLLTILMNTYRDWVRATLRHPDTVSLDEVGTLLQQKPHTQMPSPALTPEHRAEHAELGRLVWLALDDLSPEFRMTVLLADVEECAYKEIAAIMGCPIGTVMSRLSRARHLLRTRLQAVLEE